MLVDAYNTCGNGGTGLPGTVDGCSVFEASRDQDKAYACVAAGDVIAEVSILVHDDEDRQTEENVQADD